MSVSQWWAFLKINDEQHQKLEAGFGQARDHSREILEGHRALEAWNQQPETILKAGKQREGSSADGEDNLHHQFNIAFNLDPFRSFGMPIVGGTGDVVQASSETSLEFVIGGGLTPASIAWFGLGPDRAGKLPGLLGNMLVAPEEVSRVRSVAEDVFGGTEPAPEIIHRAGRYARGARDEQIEEACGAVPSALQKADGQGTGLVAISMSQI